MLLISKIKTQAEVLNTILKKFNETSNPDELHHLGTQLLSSLPTLFESIEAVDPRSVKHLGNSPKLSS